MTAITPVDLAGPPSGLRSRPHRAALLRAAAIALLLALSSLASVAVQAQESTPAPSPSPAVTPAPDARRLELALQELNDSGISGTVTLYDAGARTIVEVNARDTGQNHPSHIHAGRCDDLTPEPAYTLANVHADGKATSVIDVSLDDLLAGEYAFDMHLAPNELGTLIACANITGEPTVPEGVATPTATATATTPATPTATAPAPTQTPEASPTATGAPQPTATTAPETPAPTTPPTEAATATTAPTEAATPTATTAPTEEATPTVEATATGVSDGTGGAINENQNAASLPLFTVDASGVTGTAVLTGQGEQTVISVLLSGEAVTGGHIVHLHDGTCAAPGDYTLDLNPIGSNGVSETTVDIPLASLLEDGYFINVHASEENWDTWLVCGELSNATVGVVVPEVAPETGGGAAPTTLTPAPTAVAVTTPVPSDGTAGLSGKGVPIG
ncbi:MAG TPA: hypothetical protein VM450_00710, partial [Thermomicrobiales bacterium]|nr:hypothetical protein [Thermomicrobiales bacterium]